MLEDVKRVADSAQRMRVKLGGHHFSLPFSLKNLRKAAASRRITLLFLSSGMSKRETNRSYHNNRKKFISWTIEWRFHSTDIVFIDHGVNENTNLCSVIENHLRPGPWKHRLKQFCDEPLDSLKFFIRKHPKGPKSPFRELDIKSPIRQQLANLVVLEYPVIHVFLPSVGYDFEVLKDAIPHKTEMESVSHNHPSLNGVAFREEEIEDGDSSDTRVLDLMKRVKPDPMFQIPSKDKQTEKELNEKLDRQLLERAAQGANEGMEFDFEQGLIDAYSDLIALNNPDDFLDLEGLFSEEVKLEGRNYDNRDFSSVILEEDLEEGEIPGY
ncbi:hypothetical protein U1Q18_035868 [Sarracenia purpurea var. burkii]